MTADGHDEWMAADWLVVLTDDPDDSGLRARFADWLAADPGNLVQWKAVVRAYRALGAVDRANAGEPVTVTPLPVRWGRRGWAAACVGAAMAACLAVFALPSLVQSLQADFASGTAQIRRVELADGSVVRLAPQTAIVVDFGPDGRRVDLLDGIAVFDVSPDPARPFSVSAARATATAVGTTFEVRRVAAGDIVAVQEGAVDVATAAGSEPARLKAGEAVRVAPTGTVRRGMVIPGQVGLWTDRLVTARERPVADLVAEIRRYYDGIILLRGDGLAEQPVSGIFDVSDPAAALALIAASQKAEFYRISPWILVLDGG
ncbi:MAG: FecR domain-containing protein [Alphaproteobacteria bacterium]